MDISVEEAFEEACRALGEALVRERFLNRELAKRDEALARLADVNPPAAPGTVYQDPGGTPA